MPEPVVARGLFDSHTAILFPVSCPAIHHQPISPSTPSNPAQICPLPARQPLFICPTSLNNFQTPAPLLLLIRES